MPPPDTDTQYLIEAAPTWAGQAALFADRTGRQPNGATAAHAGKLARDLLATVVSAIDGHTLDPAAAWAALAGERGSVATCNSLANLARALAGQLIQNEKPAPPGGPVPAGGGAASPPGGAIVQWKCPECRTPNGRHLAACSECGAERVNARGQTWTEFCNELGAAQ